MAVIVDGKRLAKIILEKVHQFTRASNGIKYRPHLTIFYLNEKDSASRIYIKQKMRMGEKLNIGVSVVEYADDSFHEEQFMQKMYQANSDPQITSIIIQHPVSQNLKFTRSPVDMISPEKDVDVLGEVNRVHLLQGINASGYVPPAASGVVSLIASQQSFSGNRVAVIGQGKTLGMPTSLVLEHLSNEVIRIDHDTPSPMALSSTCDVVISASGKHNHVTSAHIKPGAGVVDGGYYDNHTNKVSTSVHMEECAEKAGWISPSPGGLGPLTVAWLFYNVLLSYMRIRGLHCPDYKKTLTEIQSSIRKT